MEKVPSRLRRSFAFAGVITLIAAMALTACGKKEDSSAGWGGPPIHTQDGTLQPAPQQPQQQVAQGGDSGLLWGSLGALAGFVAGRATAPAPAPQVVQPVAPPVYRAPTPPAPTKPSFWERLREKKVATPAAPGVTKPPVVSTTPKTFPTPQPSTAPKYGGPSSYSSVKQSAPTYKAPSFSSPARSTPSFSRR